MAEKKKENTSGTQEVRTPSFVFKLPLTEKEKQLVIGILQKDFEWNEENSSFQIKRFKKGFDEKIEAEKELRKTALALAETALLHATTIAMATTWNRRDDFNAIRKIVRKYKLDEYEYYRERDEDVKKLGALISRIKYTQNYLRPRKSESKQVILIDGIKYIMPQRRFLELKEKYMEYDDKEMLKEALLKEAIPYKGPSVEEI